jgi:hypothetical protein
VRNLVGRCASGDLLRVPSRCGVEAGAGCRVFCPFWRRLVKGHGPAGPCGGGPRDRRGGRRRWLEPQVGGVKPVDEPTIDTRHPVRRKGLIRRWIGFDSVCLESAEPLRGSAEGTDRGALMSERLEVTKELLEHLHVVILRSPPGGVSKPPREREKEAGALAQGHRDLTGLSVQAVLLEHTPTQASNRRGPRASRGITASGGCVRTPRPGRQRTAPAALGSLTPGGTQQGGHPGESGRILNTIRKTLSASRLQNKRRDAWLVAAGHTAPRCLCPDWQLARIP